MAAQGEQFSSRMGFILAAAGSAVGIGNLVGFPVAAAKGGGAVFLLLYLLFVICICLPIMLAELSLGRRSRRDPLGAYVSESGGGGLWRLAGWLAFFTPLMIAVFYTVITVWIFGYFLGAVTGQLDDLSRPGYFAEFVNQPRIFLFLLVILALVGVILVGGVKKGIERAARILMPALIVLMLILIVYVLNLDNALLGVRYYLVPDFSKVTAQVVNGALAQAFFSLSLGMGILLTYGSYIDSGEAIASNSRAVAVADTGVAFSAGLLVLPAIFALNPLASADQLSDSSLDMIFSYLPKVFLQLQADAGYVAASVVAAMFFLLVLLAAITSLVSIVEVPTASLIQEFNVSRPVALVLLTLFIGVVACFCVASFGLLDAVTNLLSYGGQSKSFFDLVVDVFYETILPLNGLLICLFVRFCWQRRMQEELERGDPDYAHSLLRKYIDRSLTSVIPLILLVVLANTVASKYFGVSLFS